MRFFRNLAMIVVFATLSVGITPQIASAQNQDAEEYKARVSKLMRQAQDQYQLYFRQPKTVLDHWAIIKFEVDLGKFDLAAYHLNNMLQLPAQKKVTDEEFMKDLLAIEETEGMSTFLRLRLIRKWDENEKLNEEAKANLERLIGIVNNALETRLSDGARIGRFIEQLFSPIPEESRYAFDQLNRSSMRATPYLVDALRFYSGKAKGKQLEAYIAKMHPDVMIPMREILKAKDQKDANDTDLRLTVIELFQQRDDTTVVPYLWHVRASSMYPQLVREAAARALASLLRTEVNRLPDSRVMLTELTKQLYHHQFDFPDVTTNPQTGEPYIPYWSWDGKVLARKPQPMPVDAVEMHFGIRHAREALQLDADYQPAQELFLALLLERTIRPNLDKYLYNPMPIELHNLLAKLDVRLLRQTLEKALDERNVPVILPLVTILGERGDLESVQPSQFGPAQGLMRALFFPDRRVQMATIRAILQTPGEKSPVIGPQVIDILSRLVNLDTQAKVLAIGVPEMQRANYRKNLTATGFNPVLVKGHIDAMEELHASADFDVILIHPAYSYQELPHLLAQLRSDSHVGLLPILLMGPKERHPLLQRIASRSRNTFVTLDALAFVPDRIKDEMIKSVHVSTLPSFTKDLPFPVQERLQKQALKNLSIPMNKEERQKIADEALDILGNMANGKITGFNLVPSKDALVSRSITESDEKKLIRVVQTLGQINHGDIQVRLADMILRNANDNVKVTAANMLLQHIKRNGQYLPVRQLRELAVLVNQPQLNPNLSSPLSVILGNVSNVAENTGQQLRQFQPQIGN